MAHPLPPKLLSCPQVSSFLHDSLASLQKTRDEQTTTLQTAMLVTPDGKLLTYDSPLPVRTLRTYCSVAASLWAIHAASSPSTAVALDVAASHPSSQPGKRGITPSESLSSLPRAVTASSASVVVTATSEADSKGDPRSYQDGSLPVSIAAGFGGGAVFVVHRLKCGLFLACSTPSPRRSSSRPGTAGTGASLATNSSTVMSPAAALASSQPATTTQSSLLPQSTPLQQAPSSPRHKTETYVPHRPASHSPSFTALSPAADTSRDLPSTITTRTRPKSPKSPLAAGVGENDGCEGGDQEQREERTPDAVGRDKASINMMGVSKKESLAATFALVRQQVDELATELDEQLSGLIVPTGNIGVNGFC